MSILLSDSLYLEFFSFFFFPFPSFYFLLLLSFVFLSCYLYLFTDLLFFIPAFFFWSFDHYVFLHSESLYFILFSFQLFSSVLIPLLLPVHHPSFLPSLIHFFHVFVCYCYLFFSYFLPRSLTLCTHPLFSSCKYFVLFQACSLRPDFWRVTW